MEVALTPNPSLKRSANGKLWKYRFDRHRRAHRSALPQSSIAKVDRKRFVRPAVGALYCAAWSASLPWAAPQQQTRLSCRVVVIVVSCPHEFTSGA